MNEERRVGRRPSVWRIAVLAFGRLADLDLAKLGFLPLVESDAENAVVKLGVDLALVDGRGEREAAKEADVAALVEEPVALLLFGRLRPVLGRDRQGLVF